MSQYAIIRVWKQASQKYGHSSIELFKDGESTYISVYPITRTVGDLNWRGVEHRSKTLVQDLQKYQNIDPNPFEYRIDGLNIQAMKDEYQRLVSAGFNFSMLGSTILRHPKTHNCSGLVFHLFKVGGGDNLLGVCERIGLKIRINAPSPKLVLGISAIASLPILLRAMAIVASNQTIRETFKTAYVVLPAIADALYKTIEWLKGIGEDDSFSAGYEPLPLLDPREYRPGDDILYDQYGSLMDDWELPSLPENNLLEQSKTFANRHITQITPWYDWAISFITETFGYSVLVPCSILVMLGLTYIAFAGKDGAASFSVITPTDIANIADHIVKRGQNSILSTIGHTLMAPVRHLLGAVINTTPSVISPPTP